MFYRFLILILHVSDLYVLQISDLDSQFDFVLLAEHFDESLGKSRFLLCNFMLLCMFNNLSTACPLLTVRVLERSMILRHRTLWDSIPEHPLPGTPFQNILYLGLCSRTRTVIKGHAVCLID